MPEQQDGGAHYRNSQCGSAMSPEDATFLIPRESCSTSRTVTNGGPSTWNGERAAAALEQRPGERVQIFWSLTAIVSLLTIIFIVTRE
jgi:hypothetical protein